MFTNKTNWIVLVVALTVVALICSSVIAFKSIEEAKNENEAANTKIEELNDALDVLYEALESTKYEVLNHEERIKNYQEIVAAWSKATPDVSEAMKRITSSYEDVIIHVHLFDKTKLVGLEDEMMSAILCAIRSNDPLSFATSFEKKINDLNKTRFDNVFTSKVASVNKNGVTFPEDEQGIKELRAYYDSFIENYAVIEAFVGFGFDTTLANFEALLDADEESDLSNAFEKAVVDINTPILPTTSLAKANDAWSALCFALEDEDVLTESVVKARELLDFYTARVNVLNNLTDRIRSEIDRIHTADPNVTYEEVTTLGAMVDELLSFEVTLDVLNTEKTDYVALLEEARLLPYKNDAFDEIKSVYDACYVRANGNRDILISLVDIKDAALNAIELAKSTQEIEGLVESVKKAFSNCFE